MRLFRLTTRGVMLAAAFELACGAVEDTDRGSGPSHGGGAGGVLAGGGDATSSGGSGGSSAGPSGTGGTEVSADASFDSGGSAGSADDAGSRSGAAGSDAPIEPPDTGRVDGNAFVHPGILSTRFELDYMKQQVAADAQPWK